jgi:hypothetical protein
VKKHKQTVVRISTNTIIFSDLIRKHAIIFGRLADAIESPQTLKAHHFCKSDASITSFKFNFFFLFVFKNGDIVAIGDRRTARAARLVSWLISALIGAGGFITARWYDLHSRQFSNMLK